MQRSHSKRLYAASLVLVSIVSATVVTAFAEDSTAAAPQTLAGRKATRSATPAPNLLAAQHLYLIRTTLLSLDAANRTGNYSVLRDNASPVFQRKHTPADLALAFQRARTAVDLASAAVAFPHLTRPPQINAAHQLHLTGTVASEPTAVAFEMLFDLVDGHWRLGALAVGPLQQTVPQRQAANSSRP